jgi:S-adenosylmethionine:diacylglycerol 3-amino-3-carboxypropyl transferase
MSCTVDSISTPWAEGCLHGSAGELCFGYTYVDSAVELRAFPPRSRIFSIAGAGGTARILAAAGHAVTAVDINPRQIAYARGRAAGMREREGSVDRMFGAGRRMLPAIGWSERRRRAFLELSDTSEQAAMWRRDFDTLRWRAATDVLFSRWLLRLRYRGAFVAWTPRGLGALMRARLERGWATHPNRSNPWAWRLLLGEARPDLEAEPGMPVVPIRFACADAARFLETSAPGSFQGFSLSNFGDGAPASYVARLHAAVRHAAAPGAIVVARSFAEPSADNSHNHAADDRSLLWGTVDVRRVEEI